MSLPCMLHTTDLFIRIGKKIGRSVRTGRKGITLLMFIEIIRQYMDLVLIMHYYINRFAKRCRKNVKCPGLKLNLRKYW